jgi:uncharacterized membrane protein
MGRFVSHPGSIEVTAENGVVMLRGPILRQEARPLLSGLARVRGVEEVRDELELHDGPGAASGLQGGVARRGVQFEWLQEKWSPAARLAGALAGVGLGIGGARSRTIPGSVAMLAGGALATRAMVNLPVKRMLGLDDSPYVIGVHKTIHVRRPVEDVFQLWTAFEDYSRFLDHVQEVQDLGDGRLRWRVRGPAGSTVQWDAQITELVPEETISWRSVPGSTIRQVGHSRFTKESDDTTRVDIHLSYGPPAGVLGHLAAVAFGVDPKRSMEDDLVRFQSLCERGRTTAHGQVVSLNELQP